VKNGTVKNGIEKKHLQVLDCGTGEYRKILQLQHGLVEKRRNDEIPDTVIIVEHPAVITLGARRIANNLLVSAEELAQRNIDVVDIRRGGGTTAHNPGQLVFYPILDLMQMSLGISEYIRRLESIGKELLGQLDLQCAAKKGYPGLWVGEKKIASIGVRVSRFITYHGMAININNDLGIFDYITPCGLYNVQMTSLSKETGKEHSMNLMKERLTKILMRYFS
jgi:lipoate-protein ligase B